MIDSHAHLDFETFQGDLDVVLERAWDAGVDHIVTIGSGRGTTGVDDALRLATGNSRVSATVGVHPHDASLGVEWKGDPAADIGAPVRRVWEERQEQVLARFGSLARRSGVVAVGEVGLDYHYDRSPRQMQRALFRGFVRLARGEELPLVIHSREATADTIRILREERAGVVGGVIHCFSGDEQLARDALELGFSLGLTGILTYPRADALRRAVRSVPLERLLVETDCPYLAPAPHRGERNEPALVAHTLHALAKLRGLAIEKVDHETEENTRRLFRLREPPILS